MITFDNFLGVVVEKYFGVILALCAIGGLLAMLALALGIVYDTVKLERDFKEECERIDAKWAQAKQERIERERLAEEERSRRLNEYYRYELELKLRQYTKLCDRSQNKKA